MRIDRSAFGRVVRDRPLLSFFLLACAVSWAFWCPVGAVALFHAGLDIFISSPVAAPLPRVMGALLTVGTLLLIPVFGRQDLSRRPRVVEPTSGSTGQRTKSY